MAEEDGVGHLSPWSRLDHPFVQSHPPPRLVRTEDLRTQSPVRPSRPTQECTNPSSTTSLQGGRVRIRDGWRRTEAEGTGDVESRSNSSLDGPRDDLAKSVPGSLRRTGSPNRVPSRPGPLSQTGLGPRPGSHRGRDDPLFRSVVTRDPESAGRQVIPRLEPP